MKAFVASLLAYVASVFAVMHGWTVMVGYPEAPEMEMLMVALAGFIGLCVAAIVAAAAKGTRSREEIS